MKHISEITRRDIFSLFICGLDIEEFFESKRVGYAFCGRLSELDFLKRIYNLKELPSFDSRFDDAEGDILQHTVNNNDYEDGWVFEDERFGLMNGEDETLLRFLCSVFHPAVRDEGGYWKRFLDAANELLRKDGYELHPEAKISGRDVYGWRKYDPSESALFIPFSQRHKAEIKSRHLTQKISREARKQIYAILERHTDAYLETSDTGWQEHISTSEYVFRDISQFYEPKCYNEKRQYAKTSDMEQFVLSTSPFSVFDAIEFYEKYNADNDFADQINALLKLNGISYRLEQGRIESTFEISIDKGNISIISEQGLKDLLLEADNYYRKGNMQIAVEKLWDAFERLKTYYSPALNKSESANKIIDDMSASETHFKTLYETEFRALTTMGNDFRIRHHETTKINFTDERQIEYFYKRCLALVSVAIMFLEKDVGI